MPDFKKIFQALEPEILDLLMGAFRAALDAYEEHKKEKEALRVEPVSLEKTAPAEKPVAAPGDDAEV